METRNTADTLENMNFHAGLIIGSSAENLALGGRYGGIAWNKRGSYCTKGFDTQSQGSNIKKQNILNLSLEHSRLNCGADSYHLIRIDTFMGFLTK
ncbi:hypothetical protein ES703_113205 [subsurface metagenome]